jgi:Cof subfamily protein (haloacid dehalogenase superfamily)
MGSRKIPSYRLLACDLDGTLMGDDTAISPRMHQALAAAQARSVLVTLATGRGFFETLAYARPLNITIPIICFQGGLIKHPLTGEILHRATMERELVRRVIKLAHARDWHLLVYTDDAVFLEGYRHERSFYADFLGLNIHRVDDLTAVISEDGEEPVKLLFVAEKATSDCIQSEISARFGRQMQIVRSHTFFVEGNPLGVNKGDALRRLSEHLGVPKSQVMAIGDQGNDAPMLTWAGLGVAMANGSDAAQAAADWVAPSVMADGAAVAIERFLLS